MAATAAATSKNNSWGTRKYMPMTMTTSSSPRWNVPYIQLVPVINGHLGTTATLQLRQPYIIRIQITFAQSQG